MAGCAGMTRKEELHLSSTVQITSRILILQVRSAAVLKHTAPGFRFGKNLKQQRAERLWYPDSTSEQRVVFDVQTQRKRETSSSRGNSCEKVQQSDLSRNYYSTRLLCRKCSPNKAKKSKGRTTGFGTEIKPHQIKPGQTG